MANAVATKGPLDAIVVGAGFAGLYALHLLRERGYRVKVFEAAPDVGGTWYWNRYPGARCDVQSLVYCYMFDKALYGAWTWSERYAPQGEILRYLNFIADRLDLRRDIAFDSRVASAAFNEETNHWLVETETGESASAPFLIMASGALSVGRLPDIPGIASFEGIFHHTSNWPHEGVDFTGKKVAVIGTGSSGVQAIPLIARDAAQLTVFQRTANFVAPARNAPMSDSEAQSIVADFEHHRTRMRRGQTIGSGDVLIGDHLEPTRPSALEVPPQEREAMMQARWDVGGVIIGKAFADTMTNEAANTVVADFYRRKISALVQDHDTAEALTPKDYPYGAKRVCVGTNYYETFNRDNVTLVDLASTPIERVTPGGIQTSAGEHPADIIVFATGFDAVTGALMNIDICGVDHLSLREAWAEGPVTYLGLAVTGFPNMFTVTGPGSPSSLSTVTVSIEQHVEWIADLLDHARAAGIRRIEAQAEAQRDWTAHVADAAEGTLFMKGNSWYLGDNIPGKPRVFLAYVRGVAAYREICDAVASDGYRGFALTGDSTRSDKHTAPA